MSSSTASSNCTFGTNSMFTADTTTVPTKEDNLIVTGQQPVRVAKRSCSNQKSRSTRLIRRGA